ncbi:exo-beta-1,3-glucanase, putative [Talaromyces stipitatus ATCC 10500]|uniref:Exo-beta-1,3-glucanase, putative n=1 Tax=Talaromyces stipitatus (strain ATCC 10500 / CBS 375.48 / QM 6759 / NRRL 1006) TaxID=441959 RepID=B8MQM9_TALSN|nr:exo-beta-1,3-glucanase, putative [Talaromyces stipitatus ATCC 10500]EED13452.1 exo-beta-1,3-glucanase, putative [Talaromyces stipitatus ATCC 10500]
MAKLLVSLLALPFLTGALPADGLVSRGDRSHDADSFNVSQFVPSDSYAPQKHGIPFPLKDESIQPWVKLNQPSQIAAAAMIDAASTCTPLTPSNPSTWWYESVTHNGLSSFMSSNYRNEYSVFRNVVTDFGADNTGATDASAAIQKAINAGPSNGGPARGSGNYGTTGQPAVVYLPAGTYLMSSSIQLLVGTVLVGDPINPPTLKAAAGFPNDHVIYAKDPNFGGTINFYIGIKNIIIDSTSVDGAQSLALLDWTVSQATQLANVVFNMPNYSTGHVGVTSQYDSNSNIILNDLTFNGGAYGLKLSGQQWILKNIKTSGTTTGIKAGGFSVVCQACSFAYAATGIDATGVSGTITVIDSSGSNLGVFLQGTNSGGAGNSVVLENVSYSGTTVQLSGSTVLTGSVTDTWVYGDLYSSGSSSRGLARGTTVTTPRSSSLLSNGNYFITQKPPTFQEYSADQVLNIKSVAGLPVYGDGSTDDTANINTILAQYAGCKVIYFPAGTYIVTNTITIPAGSRIYGEGYGTAISAIGSNYYNPNSPGTMVKIGNAGDVGVAQIVDIIFTVADVLQGCKLVEVNIAGSNPGDVGLWNSHFRIGGAAGSKVETNCGGSPDQCKAAWGLIHLTSSSSAYIENMWGWTADHDLDGNNGQTISTGRGMLIEATKGTWLVGTAMEHHTLYQYNYNNAKNVVSTFQQSETPYWQGPGNDIAPIPWSSNLIASDPGFSSCASGDAKCGMAFFERISGSSDLFLYNGMVWVFFNNNGGCSGDCQSNAINILKSSPLYIYGQGVKSVTNMFLESGSPIAKQGDNQGGWGGNIAAYLHDS